MGAVGAARAHSVKRLVFQVASEDLAILRLWAAAGWGSLCGSREPASSWLLCCRRSLGVCFQRCGSLWLFPRAQPQGCFIGHCVLGATPQAGLGLEISPRASLGHSGMWCTPSCL